LDYGSDKGNKKGVKIVREKKISHWLVKPEKKFFSGFKQFLFFDFVAGDELTMIYIQILMAVGFQCNDNWMHSGSTSFKGWHS